MDKDDISILVAMGLLVSVIINSVLMTRFLYKISILWKAQSCFERLDREISSQMNLMMRGARQISDLKKDLDLYVQLCKKQIQTMKSRAIIFDKRINAANLSVMENSAERHFFHQTKHHSVYDSRSSLSHLKPQRSPVMKKIQHQRKCNSSCGLRLVSDNMPHSASCEMKKSYHQTKHHSVDDHRIAWPDMADKDSPVREKTSSDLSIKPKHITMKNRAR